MLHQNLKLCLMMVWLMQRRYKMKELTFEQMISRLEEIKQELNNNDIELDKLIELYAEGKRLSMQAQQKLDEAVNKVENLKIEND